MKLDYFDKYEHKLQGRYPTMKMALNIFDQLQMETIVETGCMRGFQDWGAGMSTYLFAEYVTNANKYYQGTARRFHSVDNTQGNVDIAKYACHGLSVSVHLGDSLDYLRTFPGKIDLLYLDSYDMGNTAQQAREASEHQLNEIELAWPKLQSQAIILLDDTNFIGMGKAGKSRAFLKQKGCIELYNYQQSLWLKY